MTAKEAIDIIRIAIAQVEWDYPMDYAAAFDKAIEALEQTEPVKCKDCKHAVKYTTKEGACLYGCRKRSWYGYPVKFPDWYCADGEKAEGMLHLWKSEK